MLFPWENEIQQFFMNCEKYAITVNKELIWVLMCLLEWIEISQEQWIQSRKEYMVAQEALKTKKRSIIKRNAYFQNVFQKNPSDQHFTFTVLFDGVCNNQSKEEYEELFQSRDDLINRYKKIFNNHIPEWFLKDLQKSIPEDAMNIYVEIVLSVMPQDEFDTEDCTEFEYGFEHGFDHAFDYTDANLKVVDWEYKAYYTCDSNEDAYQKMILMNTSSSDFWEIMQCCNDTFDENHLERILEDVDSKEIKQFDTELWYCIQAFEDTDNKSKNKIVKQISANQRRKKFLNEKQMEWSEQRLKRMIANRVTDTFQLVLKWSEERTTLYYLLPEDENDFLAVLHVLKNEYDKNLNLEQFSDREKAKLTIQWEIVNWMIYLDVKIIGSVKMKQKYMYKNDVNVIQLYLLMQQLCPTYYWMDSSLEWLIEE
jgi:hypothetical protein